MSDPGVYDSSLDAARDIAVELLREMIRLQATYSFGVTNPCVELDIIGRQYVTAQARYTNMLREWENSDA